MLNPRPSASQLQCSNHYTSRDKKWIRIKPDLLNDPAAYIVGDVGFNARQDMIPAWPIFAKNTHKQKHARPIILYHAKTRLALSYPLQVQNKI